MQTLHRDLRNAIILKNAAFGLFCGVIWAYWFINFLTWTHSSLIGCTGKSKPGSYIDKQSRSKLQRAIAVRWHISKPQDSAVLLAGSKKIKKLSLAERLFLVEESATKWPLCKSREAGRCEPPQRNSYSCRLIGV